MNIILFPQRRDDILTASKSGETLTLNGDAVDLSSVEEGEEYFTKHPWIIDPVTRVNGNIQVGIILPHGPDADESVRFPDSLIDPEDGPLNLPGM